MYVTVDFIDIGIAKLYGKINHKMKNSCPQWDSIPVPPAYYTYALSIALWFPTVRHNRRGGVEETGWTVDKKIRVRFPVNPRRMWASDVKEIKDIFGRPVARVGCPAEGKIWKLDNCPVTI